ncbi:MAG: 3-isopropylmalate dehydratase [Candidatus Delongbacteria bacterium]|nr:3-isopropylmalate dehydratase [Candidatus Delongbacteria bacterium]
MAIFYYDQNDINTDLLFPGKYTYGSTEPDFIKEHLFEDLDPEFSKKVQAGDIVVAGSNFGCGSSREHPALGMKLVGVKAVIAKSFSRIFYRSATNQGLLLLELPELVDFYEEGMDVKVDALKGEVEAGGKVFNFPPLPTEMQNIIDDGGLLEHLKKTY